MKVFWTIPEHVKMVPREKELEPKRVMSIFKERIEKHKEELEEIEAMVNKVTRNGLGEGNFQNSILSSLFVD